MKILSPLEFKCPDCDAPCTAGYTEESHPVIVHAEPFCQDFLTKDESPDRMLKRARLKRNAASN